jgi:hypothetical protein
MSHSFVARGRGQSWQAERSEYDDGFSALFGKSSCDRLQTAVTDLKHVLWCSPASSLHNDLYFTSICAIRDMVAGM